MNFNDFWDQYPRKVAKKAAENAWKKMTDSEKDAAITKIPDHVRYWRAKDTDKEFIPHPATWLNQGRWDDEIEIEPAKPKKPPIPWYATDELTMQKGREVGVLPMPGESFAQYRQRIVEQIKRAEV